MVNRVRGAKKGYIVYLPPHVHKELKKHCLENDRTIGSFISDLVEEELEVIRENGNA